MTTQLKKVEDENNTLTQQFEQLRKQQTTLIDEHKAAIQVRMAIYELHVRTYYCVGGR